MGSVHGTANQKQGANIDGDRPTHQQYVRRTEDGDIKTVCVVPPVVEGRGGDHCESTPGSDEGSERSAKAPYLDACTSSLKRCRATAKCRGKYQETRSKPPQ